MDGHDLNELKKSLAAIAASLQVVGANSSANTQALEQMARRNRDTDVELQNLRGAFSRIDRHLVRFFEAQAEIRQWRDDIELRVQALERRQPPAA